MGNNYKKYDADNKKIVVNSSEGKKKVESQKHANMSGVFELPTLSERESSVSQQIKNK